MCYTIHVYPCEAIISLLLRIYCAIFLEIYEHIAAFIISIPHDNEVG
jgi:hypothetical protein